MLEREVIIVEDVIVFLTEWSIIAQQKNITLNYTYNTAAPQLTSSTMFVHWVFQALDQSIQSLCQSHSI